MKHHNHIVPRRTRVHEEDSDIEPDSPVDDTNSAPEMDRATQSHKGDGLEPWAKQYFHETHNKQALVPPPQHRHQRYDSSDGADEQNRPIEPPPRPKTPPKSQAQLDAEQLPRLNEELWRCTQPFDAERHGQLVSQLRDLVHRHKEEMERVKGVDLREFLRLERLVESLEEVLQRAFVRGEGRVGVVVLEDVVGAEEGVRRIAACYIHIARIEIVATYHKVDRSSPPTFTPFIAHSTKVFQLHEAIQATMGQSNSTPASPENATEPAAASPSPDSDTDMSIYEAHEYEYLYPFCPCDKCNRNELLESPYDDREVNGAVIKGRMNREVDLWETMMLFWPRCG
ncbi:hypothetical protein M409DRAFT_48608 [Zasmidium cellare ATCC 36951]|uniref:Uncharacterized protein n=1 Tax=Zasmidium cellare ATCC 36951 TaxID=1080233 RepID=A0A6A6D3N5_ZASCE|nr:uncharacterized protein M409DRAFT_48608 [Zasmidium cellare ATCC 36951]KAF2173665.1 hypothetical protein M409DRAFT_48608 [Zasmidium cellare ATCC 36951]